MEPFKALTIIASAGAFALVGAGAFGFYVGYKAGGGFGGGESYAVLNPASGTGAVSLKPVQDDIKELSKQLTELAATSKAAPEIDVSSLKPLTDKMDSLARSVESVKSYTATAQGGDGKVKVIDHSEDLDNIRQEIKALATKFEKSEPRAPKVLLDELRAINATLQSQEPATRRAIIEEIRGAVHTLQGQEPRAPKSLLDDVKSISAALSTLRAQDRAQPSIIDQIKVLTASVESLKARVAEGASAGAGAGRADAALSGEIAEIKSALLLVGEQVGKCQAAGGAAGGGATGQQAPASATTTVAITPTQTPKENSSVVFFDNVILRKDQEKQYDEIGVRLNLQALTPRQAKIAVNRQSFGLAFGELKVFRAQDVECELSLMEINLNVTQARVSLSCKR